MSSIVEWWNTLAQSLVAFSRNVISYLPDFGLALAVLLVGWFAARFLQAIFDRSGTSLNNVLNRLGRPASATNLQLSERLAALAGILIFWVVILISTAFAARVAGLQAFSDWLYGGVDYLPILVTGIVITLAGYVLSSFLRELVSATLASAGSTRGEFAGVVTQIAIIVTAVVIALDQIGIEITFLTILVAVLGGGAVLSIAIAFGFGAREFVANLIAANQLHTILHPGEHIRVGDIEGSVLEITATNIVLVNDQGRHLIPAANLQRQTTVLLSGDADE